MQNNEHNKNKENKATKENETNKEHMQTKLTKSDDDDKFIRNQASTLFDDKTMRIIFQNANGICISKLNWAKCYNGIKEAIEMDAAIIGLAETNIPWRN